MPSNEIRSFIAVQYALFLKTSDFSKTNKTLLFNKRHLFYISEKACCIIMRHYEVKKLQGEKVSQTGREGVLLLSWVSPPVHNNMNNQYLS